MAPDLSVCIVNWNTVALLDECLSSLPRAATSLWGPEGNLSTEVIVVDNASADGSAQMVAQEHPAVTVIANSENVGYAAANNQALRLARAEFKLLLNPDIVASEGSFVDLVAFLRARPKAAAVAPKLVYPKGGLQFSCRSFPTPDVIVYEALGLSRLFPRSRRFGKYRMTWWDYNEARTVDQPMASALLLRGEALDQVELFDEGFPIFFNDVDLCKRLRDAGWEIWFDPEVTMVHHEGASTSQARPAMIAESHRSFLRFYRKHYLGKVNPASYWMATGLLRLGGWTRMKLARGCRPGSEIVVKTSGG